MMKSENCDEQSPLLGSLENSITNTTVVDLGQANGTVTTVENIRGFRPLTLAWKNISAKVIKKPVSRCCGSTTEKDVLMNVSGIAKPKELVAIIGPSGGGKTTLLSCLTHRVKSNIQATINVYVNGYKIDRSIRNVSAFVFQNEQCFERLTVQQHLYFRAMLRMDSKLKTSQRLYKIRDVTQQLGLTGALNTSIANISGGERRRMTFAAELLTDPPILICDEPTSCLDSFMAENVMTSLRAVADRGHTVICSIHQASAQLFQMFDRVIFLTQGKIVFHGNRESAFSFFKRNRLECPLHDNPAEFYVQQIAIKPSDEIQSRKKITGLCEAFARSEYNADINKFIDSEIGQNKAENEQDIKAFIDQKNYQASWCRQFRMVVWRSALLFFKNYYILQMRLFQPMVLALIIGLLFKTHSFNQDSIININGALFFILTVASYSNVMGVITMFPNSIAVSTHEYSIGLYRTDTYFLGRSLIELPVHLIMPAVFIAISYFMITLYRDVIVFLRSVAVLILVVNVSVSFGMMVATTFGSVETSIQVTSPLITLMMLLGAFFISNGTKGITYKLFQHVSWFKYGFEILAINQWEQVTHIDCASFAVNRTSHRCLTTGKTVLEYLNFDQSHIMEDYITIVVQLFLFRVLSYIGFHFRTRLTAV